MMKAIQFGLVLALYLVTLLLCVPAFMVLDLNIWCMGKIDKLLENKHV